MKLPKRKERKKEKFSIAKGEPVGGGLPMRTMVSVEVMLSGEKTMLESQSDDWDGVRQRDMSRAKESIALGMLKTSSFLTTDSFLQDVLPLLLSGWEKLVKEL